MGMPRNTGNVTGFLLIAGAAAITILCLAVDSVRGQALPPPRDGDIRVLYWELQNRTDVWLTLEPKLASGKPAPPTMVLTLTLSFPGKTPKGQPEHVDLRAHPGMLWAPRIQLSVVVDGERLQLEPAGSVGLGDGGLDYVWVPVSISMLRQMAQARRVSINALGLDLELIEPQRAAVGQFLDRVLSDNPGQFKR
jgi:hypothetical protein